MSPLQPHIQEFLRGEEMLPAGTGGGDSLPWTSMPDDPEPSPMQNTAWIKWCAWQLHMPTWWQELKEALEQDNQQEFAQRVWASFKVPKSQSCAVQVDSDHSKLPAHHSLDRGQFLPLLDMLFSRQDFWLTQPQKTLAYVKALQHWVERLNC